MILSKRYVLLKKNKLPSVTASLYANSKTNPTYAVGYIPFRLTYMGTSLSFWVKKNTSTSYGAICGVCGRFVSIPESQSDNISGRYIVYTGSSTYLSTGTLLGVDGIGYIGNITSGLSDAAWHHIAMTISTSKLFSLYRDGKLIGSFTGTSSTFPSEKSQMANDWFGILGTSEWSGQRNFDGYISRICMFNSVLSESQILEDYSLRLLPPTNPTIVHYWPGNIANGTVKEYVSNCNMTIYGEVTKSDVIF